jgi:hypothetical protein
MSTLGSIATLIVFLTFGNSALAVESQAEFSGFQLSTCNSNRSVCLILSAEKAIGSHMSPIYTLKNASVKVIEQKNQRTQTILGTDGYLDFQLQRAVFTQAIGPGIYKETIIDLKVLKLSSTVMK